MGFFEVFWHGEAIGDGGDLDEALTAYLAVKPEEGSWAAACAAAQAQPCVRRYASFEAFLDNADELETIPVTAAMIEAALLNAAFARVCSGRQRPIGSCRCRSGG